MEVNMSTDQSIENDAKIWKFIYGFADTIVLKCCVDLEIADTIHKRGEPMTLTQLATQLSNDKKTIDIDRLYRLMRYLVHLELFTSEASQLGEIKYGLLPPAKFLIRGWRKSMVDMITVIDKDFIAPWYHLKEGLDSNCDAFEKALGKSIWDYMSENPKKNQLFNEAMACDSRLVTSALVNDGENVFKGIKTLVDVGGGTGTTVKVISNAFPEIKCAVYDLPHVIADSPAYPNIDRIEGDMFKSIPNADAILMKWILHNWNDDECIQILKLCKDAIPRDGGKVIIIDIVLDVNSKHPYTKMRVTLDLDMMLNCRGKERTEMDWKKLMEAAGFNGYKITQISALQSVIEAYPF